MSHFCATLFDVTIVRMYYIQCNDCGAPAGGDDNMGDDPSEALRRARQAGFRRRKRGGRMVDLCNHCLHADQVVMEAGGDHLRCPRCGRIEPAS